MAKTPQLELGAQDPIPVTVGRCAALFDVTEKTVRSWIRAGLPTMSAGGKGRGNGAMLDLVEVVPWYLGENALDVAKTRLASAQAERHEMENALRRGELADVAEVKSAMAEHIAAARAKLLTMPTKLGPQLINVADPNAIATRLRTEVNAALTELASWRLGGHSGADDRADRRVETTAGADSKPVGGRRKKTQ